MSSSTRTVGKFAFNRFHVLPRSSVRKMPVSVPTYSTSGLRVSSVSVFTTSPLSVAVSDLKVAPKSVLTQMYGS